MIFRKYHVVVMRDKEGSCRRFSLRGFVVVFFFLLLGGLAASNAYLWKYYKSYNSTAKALSEAEKNSQDQKTQLLSLTRKISTIQKDLTRIQDFDSKLRVMINMDRDPIKKTASLGGTTNMDFSKSYLPLYRQELLSRKMHDFLRQLNMETRLEEVRQQELIHKIRANQNILESTPSIWPTEGWVTSKFGWRSSPFTGKREFHKGLDISAPIGTPIYAPSRGKVTFAGTDGGYGKCIRINHGSGIGTRFGHMHRIVVKKGAEVTRGELIGYVGSTGRSTGPHLHYEVRLNRLPVDPYRYILN